jgi:hypothetical protein
MYEKAQQIESDFQGNNSLLNAKIPRCGINSFLRLHQILIGQTPAASLITNQGLTP